MTTTKTLLIASVIFFSCKKDRNSGPPEQLVDPLSISQLSTITTDMPPDTYTDLVFTDEQTGYAISMSGRIVKTINGGTNWQQLNSPTTLPLRDLFFLDANHGYAIGGTNATAILLITRNAGASWTVQTLSGTPEIPYTVHFNDVQTGYISGFNYLAKTTNEGATWNNINDHAFHIFTDINFKNQNEGIATSLHGVYMRTKNKGQSWDSIKAPISDHLYHVYYAGNKTFLKADMKLVQIEGNNSSVIDLPLGISQMLFLNSKQAIGIGGHYTGAYYFPNGDIFTTNNGWQTWEQKTYTTNESMGFHAIAKMGNSKKIMMLGNGLSTGSVVVILSY